MQIKPDILRTLRLRKRLSLQQLADKAKLSRRQLARLESSISPPGSVRDHTLKRLSDALEVDPEVLIGERSVPESAPTNRMGQGERVQASARLCPEAHLAYSLIKRRYGVNATTIFNLAPLLFTLLAEGSLVWRRKKLKEVREAAGRLSGLGEGHLAFANSAYRATEGADVEEESVERLDLFGGHASEHAFDLGYDRSKNNPFADYLRQLAKEIAAPEVIDVDSKTLGYGVYESIPEHVVCKSDIEKITGGSMDAWIALRTGAARLEDIPEELWAENATEQRAKWLEARLAERLRSEDIKGLIEL